MLFNNSNRYEYDESENAIYDRRNDMFYPAINDRMLETSMEIQQEFDNFMDGNILVIKCRRGTRVLDFNCLYVKKVITTFEEIGE